MISLFLFPVFLLAAVSFGWVIATCLIGERRIWAVIPIALISGIGGYVFFLNLAGYVMPIRIAMWLVFAALGIVGFFGWCRYRGFRNLELGELSSKQFCLLILTAAVISLLTGITALRTLADSDVKMGHIPLARTITEGNFPVLDPSAPDHRIAYHYAPDLLSAAWNKIAGVPLWLGYDLQIFLFVFALFFMAFLIAFKLFRGFSPAYAASFLFLYGGGFTWIHVFDGVGVLFNRVFRGIIEEAPWKFLHRMTTQNFDASLVTTVFSHTVAMGIPIMLLGIWLFWRARERGKMSEAIVSGLAFGFLALSLETHLAVVFLALGVMLGVSLLARTRESYPPFWRMLGIVLMILFIAGTLARFQGGILSNPGGESSSFSFVKDFWNSDITDKGILPFRLGFFEEFGLPLLLFFPALFAFRRDWRAVFIACIAFVAFLLPLAVHYVSRPREMERFFGLAIPVFSFIAGGYILTRPFFQKLTTARTFVLVGVIASMSLAALWFQAFAIAFPLGEIGKFNRPFFAIPDKPSPFDDRAYAWMRANTALGDRFYPYSEELVGQTGRFTPGFYVVGWGYSDEITLYRSLSSSCSREGFKRLGIRYLYIGPALADFETRCLSNLDARLVYSEEAVDGDFRKIYRLSE